MKLKEIALIEFVINLFEQDILTEKLLFKLIKDKNWRFYNFEIFYWCNFVNEWLTEKEFKNA